MDLSKRLADAKARLEKASETLSTDDRAEIAQREELAAIEDQAAKTERARRELDLDRRLEKAEETYSSEEIEGVLIQGYADTFVMRRNGKAHSTWADSVKREREGKKVDRSQVDRNYILACVVDWNGVDDFDSNSESSRALHDFLKVNPGVMSPLIDSCAKLVGVFADTRKSRA